MIGNVARPMLGDPGRLTQTQFNLPDNAIKLTENDRITLTID